MAPERESLEISDPLLVMEGALRDPVVPRTNGAVGPSESLNVFASLPFRSHIDPVDEA